MKHYILVLFIGCLFFLPPLFSHGQSVDSALTFIRLNSYIGYVIDSAENNRCGCINYAGKNFSYGSLVQLHDSNIVFRMKMSNRESNIDVPLTQKEIQHISAMAAGVHQALSAEKTEPGMMQKLSGDSAGYKQIDFFDVKYKAVAAMPLYSDFIAEDSSFDNLYFNAGFGLCNRAGKNTYYSFGGEFGSVVNKNIISARVWYSKEHETLFTESLPKEHLFDAGLLYGRLFPVNRVSFSLNAGIAYSTGVVRGKLLKGSGFFSGLSSTYEEIDLETIGIPVKAEMLVGTKRKSIASFAVLADINARYVYYGILISLRISNENRPVTRR